MPGGGVGRGVPLGAGDLLGERDEVGDLVGASVSQRSSIEALLWAKELVSDCLPALS